MIDHTWQDIRAIQKRSARMLHKQQQHDEKRRIRGQYTNE